MKRNLDFIDKDVFCPHCNIAMQMEGEPFSVYWWECRICHLMIDEKELQQTEPEHAIPFADPTMHLDNELRPTIIYSDRCCPFCHSQTFRDELSQRNPYNLLCVGCGAAVSVPQLRLILPPIAAEQPALEPSLSHTDSEP